MFERWEILPESERAAGGDLRRQARSSDAVLGSTNGNGKGTNMIVVRLLDSSFWSLLSSVSSDFRVRFLVG